jgi:hypothetical protein
MKDLFNADTLLGFLIGIAATMTAMFWQPIQQQGLTAYQGFVTSNLALLGAAGAIWIVHRQIQATRESDDKRRSRRAYAARAMLSLTLASLAEYAEACCHKLVIEAVPSAGRPLALTDTISAGFVRMPALPDGVLTTLKELLENGEPDVQKAVADLTVTLQVHVRRAATMHNRSVSAEWYYTVLADTVAIYALANAIAPYARLSSETLPTEVTETQLCAAALGFGLKRSEWPMLYERLESEVSNA